MRTAALTAYRGRRAPHRGRHEWRRAHPGGGFNFLFLDPSTGQGAGYRIGSINASIEILGALAAPTSPEIAAAPVVADPAPARVPAVVSRPANTTPRSVSGSPPAPSPTALQIERAAVTGSVVSAIEITTTNWYPLYLALALALAFGVTLGSARAGRGRFPTLDWIFTKADRRALRFVAVYLRW